jgi:hypothetical protein
MTATMRMGSARRPRVVDQHVRPDQKQLEVSCAARRTHTEQTAAGAAPTATEPPAKHQAASRTSIAPLRRLVTFRGRGHDGVRGVRANKLA